jgi:hypothetical protein
MSISPAAELTAASAVSEAVRFKHLKPLTLRAI